MNKYLAVALALVVVIIISAIFTPIGRAVWNTHFGVVQKVDDATNYQTKKQVEDTCRAMQASYVADSLTYEQYNGNESAEKQSWAEQAKMRANKTAATYNEYILKNSYVWSGNIPTDIKQTLDYLQ